MANNIFAENPGPYPGLAGGIPIWLDATAKLQRAAVFSATTGVPLPGNVVIVPSSGVIPPFGCAAPVVYIVAPSFDIIALAPSGQRTAPIVTGSKGANAALTSLMAALGQSGLGLVTDQTS
jgi:hypothetical protein